MKLTCLRPAAAVAAVAPLLLVACGGAMEQDSAAGTQNSAKAIPASPPFPCDLHGNGAFADRCTLEWLPGEKGKDRTFLINHPDGGFRRFHLSADGAEIDVADGAENLDLSGPKDTILTIQVAQDIYRLPLDLLVLP